MWGIHGARVCRMKQLLEVLGFVALVVLAFALFAAAESRRSG